MSDEGTLKWFDRGRARSPQTNVLSYVCTIILVSRKLYCLEVVILCSRINNIVYKDRGVCLSEMKGKIGDTFPPLKSENLIIRYNLLISCLRVRRRDQGICNAMCTNPSNVSAHPLQAVVWPV